MSACLHQFFCVFILSIGTEERNWKRLDHHCLSWSWERDLITMLKLDFSSESHLNAGFCRNPIVIDPKIWDFYPWISLDFDWVSAWASTCWWHQLSGDWESRVLARIHPDSNLTSSDNLDISLDIKNPSPTPTQHVTKNTSFFVFFGYFFTIFCQTFNWIFFFFFFLLISGWVSVIREPKTSINKLYKKKMFLRILLWQIGFL